MSDARSATILGGKIVFFIAALLLVTLTLVWPHFNKNTRYEIKEARAHTQSERTSARSTPTKHVNPVDDIEEGEMVFNGQTQLIITPKK